MNYKTAVLFIAATTTLLSCGDQKETKTLYGSWDPILTFDEKTNKWTEADENFILTVSGKCENIVVERTEKGDIVNPDVPMPNAKCGGNRDELSFTDTIYTKTDYALKMDASKDTLTGTATTDYHNESKPVIVKIKFFRIGADDDKKETKP